MKYAAYVAWILCETCEFGEKSTTVTEIMNFI